MIQILMGDFAALEDFFNLIVTICLIIIIVYIVFLVAIGKIFKKAGEEGWYVIIPYFYGYILTKIAGLHPMYFLFVIALSLVKLLGMKDLESIATLVSLYGLFMCSYNISKRFGKSTGFAIATMFFPFIFVPILGFSSQCVYDESIPVSKHGIFGNTESNDYSTVDNSNQPVINSSNEIRYCTNCGKQIVNPNERFCTNCGKEIIK